MLASEYGDSGTDFEDLLEAAEAEARTGVQMDIVASIRAKYLHYKGNTFISERQLAQLEKIAKV
jgi:hypothetical protein